MIYDIIFAIIGNTKRIEKLKSLKSVYERRMKAKNYVVAEAREQKIKLSNDEIVQAVSLLTVKYI